MQWSKVSLKEAAPCACIGGSVTVYDQNKLFVVSGSFEAHASQGTHQTLFMLNAKDWEWNPLRPSGTAPSAVDYHTCVLYQKKLYLFGANDKVPSLLSSFLYVYDIEKNAWSKTSMDGLVQRHKHTATLVDGHRVFVFGGDPRENAQAECEFMVMNLEHLTISKPLMVGDVPTNRSSHTATLLGSKIYVFGGLLDKVATNDMYILNTATLRWQKPKIKGVKPKPRFGHTMVLVGSRLLLFGGRGETDFFRDTWVFDTAGLTWHQLTLQGAEPEARYGHCAALIENRVVMFGGMNTQYCEPCLHFLDIAELVAAEAEEAASSARRLRFSIDSDLPLKEHRLVSSKEKAATGGTRTSPALPASIPPAPTKSSWSKELRVMKRLNIPYEPEIETYLDQLGPIIAKLRAAADGRLGVISCQTFATTIFKDLSSWKENTVKAVKEARAAREEAEEQLKHEESSSDEDEAVQAPPPVDNDLSQVVEVDEDDEDNEQHEERLWFMPLLSARSKAAETTPLSSARGVPAWEIGGQPGSKDHLLSTYYTSPREHQHQQQHRPSPRHLPSSNGRVDMSRPRPQSARPASAGPSRVVQFGAKGPSAKELEDQLKKEQHARRAAEIDCWKAEKKAQSLQQEVLLESVRWMRGWIDEINVWRTPMLELLKELCDAVPEGKLADAAVKRRSGAWRTKARKLATASETTEHSLKVLASECSRRTSSWEQMASTMTTKLDRLGDLEERLADYVETLENETRTHVNDANSLQQSSDAWQHLAMSLLAKLLVVENAHTQETTRLRRRLWALVWRCCARTALLARRDKRVRVRERRARFGRTLAELASEESDRQRAACAEQLEEALATIQDLKEGQPPGINPDYLAAVQAAVVNCTTNLREELQQFEGTIESVAKKLGAGGQGALKGFQKSSGTWKKRLEDVWPTVKSAHDSFGEYSMMPDTRQLIAVHKQRSSAAEGYVRQLEESRKRLGTEKAKLRVALDFTRRVLHSVLDSRRELQRAHAGSLATREKAIASSVRHVLEEEEEQRFYATQQLRSAQQKARELDETDTAREVERLHASLESTRGVASAQSTQLKEVEKALSALVSQGSKGEAAMKMSLRRILSNLQTLPATSTPSSNAHAPHTRAPHLRPDSDRLPNASQGGRQATDVAFRDASVFAAHGDLQRANEELRGRAEAEARQNRELNRRVESLKARAQRAEAWVGGGGGVRR